MADMYIRGIDPAIKEKLKEKAKDKGISLNRYTINILSTHQENINMKSIAEKYENLVKDVVSIYQEKLDDCNLALEKSNYILEKILESSR